jgi:hypothetical protein
LSHRETTGILHKTGRVTRPVPDPGPPA